MLPIIHNLCYMVIVGYQISRDNSNSQQQSTIRYIPTSKSLLDPNPPTRVKTTTNTIDM